MKINKISNIVFFLFCLLFFFEAAEAKGRFRPHPAPAKPGMTIKDCPIMIQFSLDWTNCQIHRASDYSPIEILLSGSIESNESIVWTLANVNPGQGIFQIKMVEDIFGNQYSLPSTGVPITWEISIDGGPFNPMTIQPDQTVSTVFPPGLHNFQLRITGMMEYHQADGYYRLELSQCLVPQF